MMEDLSNSKKAIKRSGFTLLELLTVVVIILILASILLPAISGMRDRARFAQCSSNLKSLYVATNSYVLDNQKWPQIDSTDTNSSAYSEAWYEALKKYGIDRKSWLCPSIQAALRQTNQIPKDFTLDYLPTPFDSKPRSPYQWSTHPWFSERGAVHGNGNLVILTNGSVKSLNDLKNQQQDPP